MALTRENSEVWIGVDLGTTGVRTIAYDAKGTNICSSESAADL